jgi:hypothetical protein
MEERQQGKWDHIPTYAQIRQAGEEKARMRALASVPASPSQSQCQSVDDVRARMRKLPVWSSIRVALQELAEHFWFYIPLGVLVAMPGAYVTLFSREPEINALILIPGGIFSAVFSCAVIFRAYKSFTGEDVSARDAFRGGLGNYFPVFKLCFLSGFTGFLMAAFHSYSIDSGLAWSIDRIWRVAFGLILSIGSLYLRVALIVIGPVCVIEGLAVVRSLKRSMHLTKGQRWPVFGLFFVYCMISIMLHIAVILLCVPPYRETGVKVAQILFAPFAVVFIDVMSVYLYHWLKNEKDAVAVRDSGIISESADHQGNAVQ